MKKIIIIGLSLIMVIALFTGCTDQGMSGTVTMAGSTSMEKLAKALGEGFEAENEGVTVDVQAGGSSAGYAQCSDGSVDIGNLSRALKDTEKSADILENVVAYDGIAVVVNPANNVTALTSEQIAMIYKGEITNWNEVGGADGEIVAIGREAGSGTRDGFESVLDVEDMCVYDSELTETGSVKTTVAATEGAIGYISLGYVDDTVIALTVDGVYPTTETVQDNSYAVQRPFTMIIKADNESEEALAFLEYVLSDEGQSIVEQLHFVPVQ